MINKSTKCLQTKGYINPILEWGGKFTSNKRSLPLSLESYQYIHIFIHRNTTNLIIKLEKNDADTASLRNVNVFIYNEQFYKATSVQDEDTSNVFKMTNYSISSHLVHVKVELFFGFCLFSYVYFERVYFTFTLLLFLKF